VQHSIHSPLTKRLSDISSVCTFAGLLPSHVAVFSRMRPPRVYFIGLTFHKRSIVFPRLSGQLVCDPLEIFGNVTGVLIFIPNLFLILTYILDRELKTIDELLFFFDEFLTFFALFLGTRVNIDYIWGSPSTSRINTDVSSDTAAREFPPYIDPYRYTRTHLLGIRIWSPNKETRAPARV
jgi:hypothetical protein